MTRIRTAASLAFVAAAALSLTACAQGDDDLGALTLEGSWTFVSGSGADGEITPVEGAPITLAVDDKGAVSGSDGCNNVMSPATVEGDKLTFGPIAGTMMACDQAIMDVATAYTTALDSVTTGAVEDTQLVLTGDGVELRFDEG